MYGAAKVRRSEDLRCLCKRCVRDYEAAGYKVRTLKTKYEKCDKCDRQGRTCVISPPKRG